MGFSSVAQRTIVVALFSSNGLAHAQGVSNANPFENTCAMIENVTKNAKVDCMPKGQPKLSYVYSFGRDTDAAKKVFNDLTRIYGQPESARGKVSVWRAGNPDSSARQKKTVTIVLTLDPNGESKIMMDRVRPGTVFATDKKIKKPKKTKTKSLKKQKVPAADLKPTEVSR